MAHPHSHLPGAGAFYTELSNILREVGHVEVGLLEFRKGPSLHKSIPRAGVEGLRGGG